MRGFYGTSANQMPNVWRNEKWRVVDASKKDFSFGKALVGAALIGKVGVLAGFLGKDKHCYYCGKCGFKHEYDA